MEERWLSADELLALTKAQGFDVTQRQLERWRKVDLLPRPRRRSQGRGRGMQSEYPPQTASQLLDLCRLHFGHGPERRLDVLRFALWWRGYPIPLPVLKETLHRLALEPWLETKKRLKRYRGDALDRAEKASGLLLQCAATLRVRGASIIRRMIRNCRAPEDAHSFLASLLQMFLGGLPSFRGNGFEHEKGERTLGQIVERGLGIEAGRTARIGDGEPWLKGMPGADIEDVVFPFLDTPKVLDTASELELIQAREDLQSLSRVSVIASVIKATSGADVFGASAASKVLQLETPLVRIIMLLFLTWLRKSGRGGDIDRVKNAFEEQTH